MCIAIVEQCLTLLKMMRGLFKSVSVIYIPHSDARGLYHPYLNTLSNYINSCGLCSQGNIIDFLSKGDAAQEMLNFNNN